MQVKLDFVLNPNANASWLTTGRYDRYLLIEPFKEQQSVFVILISLFIK